MAPLRRDRQLPARLGGVAQALADSDSPASKGRLAGADPSNNFDIEPITRMRACADKRVPGQSDGCSSFHVGAVLRPDGDDTLVFVR